MIREIENIKKFTPVLACFKTNGLDRRHWQAIGKALDETIYPNKINIRWLFKRELHKGRKFDIIKAITDQARKEY